MAKYVYTHSGTFSWEGRDVSSVLDTESPEFLDKLGWVMKATGISKTVFEPYINRNLDGSSQTTGIVIRFTNVETGLSEGVDGFLLFMSPSVAAHEINRSLALGIDPKTIGQYKPPAPPKPPEDWRVEGSPIAGPLREGETKYFRCFKLNAGDEWRSPVSNAVYRAGYLGGFREPGQPAFSVTPALFAAFCAERREG